MTSPADPLARSRADLRAARLLASGGFPAQATSRAYFAAFHAAAEALRAAGETRTKHSGIISAFGERLVRQGAVSAEAGRLLRSLFERRNAADYTPIEVEPASAEVAISDAERFVDAVAEWLRRRPGEG